MGNVPVSPFDVDDVVAAGDEVSIGGAAARGPLSLSPVEVMDGAAILAFGTVDATDTYISARNAFLARLKEETAADTTPIQCIDIADVRAVRDAPPVRAVPEIPLQVLCLIWLARLEMADAPATARYHAEVAVAACWRAGGGR